MLNSKKVRMRQVLVLSLSLLLISGCGVNWKVNIQILRLQSKDTGLRSHAAIVLARIGPEAKAAVPALIQALKNGDGHLVPESAAIATSLRHDFNALLKELKSLNGIDMRA